MSDRRVARSTWRPAAAGLVAIVLFAVPAWGQQRSSSSSRDQSKDQNKEETITRTFGKEGDYRTEVTIRTKGKLTDDDKRQAALLVAEAFAHVDEASEELEADDSKEARDEVNKSLEAIKAVRSMLPTMTIHTKTTAPDGKVIYEDEREDQNARVSLFEGIIHKQTLAPILEARRNAVQVAGVHLVEAETIVTEAVADLDTIEAELKRAAKSLQDNKPEAATKALALALVRGIEAVYSKEDSELASARDAIWLAQRALKENNVAEALVNLEISRQRLQLYRELASQDQRREVDQMLREVAQLEAQLRQEGNQPVARAERDRQGHTLTSWWDKLTGWFHRHG